RGKAFPGFFFTRACAAQRGARPFFFRPRARGAGNPSRKGDRSFPHVARGSQEWPRGRRMLLAAHLRLRQSPAAAAAARAAGEKNRAPQHLSAGAGRFPAAPPSAFAACRPRPAGRRAFATTGRRAAQDAGDPFRPPVNPFAALGLPMSASKPEVKRRYYEIAKECHPDTAALHGGGGSAPGGTKTDSRRFLRAKTAYEMIVHQNWRPEPQLVRSANGYYTFRWPAEGCASPGDMKAQRVAAYSARWDPPTTRWWDAGEERRKKFCEDMASRTMEKTIYDPLQRFWRSWRRLRPDPEATARGEVAEVAPPEWWLRFLRSVLVHADGSGFGLAYFCLFAALMAASATHLALPGGPPSSHLAGGDVKGRWVLVPAFVAKRIYPDLKPGDYIVMQPRAGGTPRGPL
ncbi:MAG: hypothetical protein BJ554DRAFT_3387, partial [Olpidium bornovanus]